MWRGFRGMVVAGLVLAVMLVLSIGLRPVSEDLPSRSGVRGIGDGRRIPDGLPSDWVKSKVDPGKVGFYFRPVERRLDVEGRWIHRDTSEILEVPSFP